MARPPEPDARSGEAAFVSHLGTIERVIAFVCARHHVSGADADDFASFVKLRFVESDYAILKKFQGRSSLRTYLTVVVQRLFLDHRTSAWGKWRPSANAKRLGPAAILLEQLMVRDGYGFEEACELLRTNHRVTAPRAELDRIAARLPIRARRRFESEEALADTPARDSAADAAVTEGEREATAARVTAALRQVLERLETQDRLILTMRFEDGRTVADIASTLRLDPKALYRRVERLLRELRTGLEAAGIDAAAVTDMLESPAVSLEWSSREDQESGAPRPSLVKGAQPWR